MPSLASRSFLQILRPAGSSLRTRSAAWRGGQMAPPAQPALRWAARQATSERTSAFVLAALSNALEMDAMHVASSVHPGTVVVPAALAVANAVNADGAAL